MYVDDDAKAMHLTLITELASYFFYGLNPLISYLYSDDDTTSGCPPIDISREDIILLRKLSYTWTKIARMLGISRQTL